MKKLCIVGGGVTRDKAPYKSDCVIWSTASVGLNIPRCDVVFELHDGVFSDDELNKFPAVYMRERSASVPNSLRFPIEDLIVKHGKHFNGTISMMLGFAAMQGYKDIELYGIDFSSDDEYSMRNQFFYIMGYLSGQGYKIKVCPGGYMVDTCSTYMYEDDRKSFITESRKRMKEQTAQDEATIRALNERKMYTKGVMDTLEKIERRY